MTVGQYEAVSDGYGRMLLTAIAKIVNRPVTQADVDNFTDWVESSSDRLEAALMGGHSTREQLAREYFAGQLAERKAA